MGYDWAMFFRVLALLAMVISLCVTVIYFAVLKKKYIVAGVFALIMLIVTPPVATYAVWLEWRSDFVLEFYIRIIGLAFFLVSILAWRAMKDQTKEEKK